MADVDLTALLEQKQREFGTQNQSGGRFEDDFMDAANRSINEMNRKAALSTQITRIADLVGTIDNLDTKYEDVISVGISLHLMLSGRRPAKGAGRAIGAINTKFQNEIQSMATDIRNLATDADSDDETATNIGLGPLG